MRSALRKSPRLRACGLRGTETGRRTEEDGGGDGGHWGLQKGAHSALNSHEARRL